MGNYFVRMQCNKRSYLVSAKIGAALLRSAYITTVLSTIRVAMVWRLHGYVVVIASRTILDTNRGVGIYNQIPDCPMGRPGWYLVWIYLLASVSVVSSSRKLSGSTMRRLLLFQRGEPGSKRRGYRVLQGTRLLSVRQSSRTADWTLRSLKQKCNHVAFENNTRPCLSIAGRQLCLNTRGG